MKPRFITAVGLLLTFLLLLLLHFPLLHLPYFWDEAGYYIPAAYDFYLSGRLVPESTLPTGHTPLVTIYLALAWRVFGFSPLVTRAAMTLIAAATVVALDRLARRVAAREIAFWSTLLLALSPPFFAQSTLAHLDLAAALFTTLAVLALLERRFACFAVAASLAILSKETAAVLIPVAWVFTWWRVRAQHEISMHRVWAQLSIPLLPLLAWGIYYHHVTGYWTGNREYLEYNLYTTLDPVRVLWSLLRRLYEVFVGGFNWLLTAGALTGIWLGSRSVSQRAEVDVRTLKRPSNPESDFLVLAGLLCGSYLLMLSVVGGAILPRYLLPVFPVFYLAALALIDRLPVMVRRLVCSAAAVCFVAAWFINPPYPFPYEDNLSYADFVRLHHEAARFLETRSNAGGSGAGSPRILTAWPATDELTRPVLGYVSQPLRIVPLKGFGADDFEGISPYSFDVLYLYSRQWEPHGNWMARFPRYRTIQERHFDYRPQVPEEFPVTRYEFKLVKSFERRGQWIRIYSRLDFGVSPLLDRVKPSVPPRGIGPLLP